ncbi:Kiwa anti-phage protein KwaB-like domain-containing protein [Guptibacillus hwajinpoensis]|uniref:Kiwa anti-phage protein KwaB-like domain-containing protein n=1 Tax=Guptibacillus hwajinpoensis TaxID=208199 RepID=UPI001F558D5F|nr:Kiwa anti-phage protein KwaB-like domain-containing protein [Pseudalkalibacillus hwajinpoensis]
MLEELTEFNRQFQTLQDTSENGFRLFIVGSQLREGTATRYEDCPPEEMIIDRSIQNWVLSGTQDVMNEVLNYEVVNIQEVDESGESIRRYIELHELSLLNQWKDTIANNETETNARRQINNDHFKPKALIASFQYNGRTLYFLKAISERVLLKTQTILGFDVGRECYELDEGHNQKLFLDDRWDAIIFDSNVIMYNESKILSLFKYYEKFREAAEQVLTQIDGLDILSEDADLQSLIGYQVTWQKKLARAAQYSFDNIRRERIESLINDNMIPLSLNVEGRIECTTKEEAKVVIDIILDNYVTSLITDENYKALNKSRM